jgi:hypothetical protein
LCGFRRVNAVGYWEGFRLRKAITIVLALLGTILFSYPAWAWFAEGDEIVAIIAADDLTATARSHVAQILGVPSDKSSAKKAMAAASIRPDTEFRSEDRGRLCRQTQRRNHHEQE